MTTPVDADARAIGAVLNTLAEHISGAWISDELPPHNSLEQNLPAIVVEDMPGSTDIQPFGGAPLVHTVAVDVTVYAREISTARAIAAGVERIIHAMVLDQASPIYHVAQPITMHKRPDWNDRVRRVGGEFALRTPTAR